MVRKNIWDILSDQEVNIILEYQNLWDLFHTKKIVHSYLGNYVTLESITREYFLRFKARGSVTSYTKLLNILNLRPQISNNESKLENLDLLIELIVLISSELRKLYNSVISKSMKSSIEEGIVIVSDTIFAIVKKTNQKLISLEDNKMIVVPNDEAVTTVADLILPDDKKLALDVLGYSHYSNKDNLIEKRKILNSLANYLEPKLNSKKNDAIGFVLNNFCIRHGNKRNKQNVESLTDEDMNSLYDKLYRDILYYLLEQEHEEFKDLVKDLKQHI